MPEGDLQNQYTRSVDIFAYGLLVLELVTKCRLDVNKNQNWQVGGGGGKRRGAGFAPVRGRGGGQGWGARYRWTSGVGGHGGPSKC